MSDEIFSIPKAAKYCAISRWTLWKLVKTGELKASRTSGGHYRILKKDLESFVFEKEIYPLSNNHSSSKKVLIVDNDPQILDMLKKMLSRNEFQTEVASDGFEAGIKVMEFKPGLVLLDLFMPWMDGFEVCRRLKENSSTSYIKILAITGHDTEENRERIIKAGADGYLKKPVGKNKLLQSILDLLNKSNQT